jgi:hypothetical protein
MRALRTLLIIGVLTLPCPVWAQQPPKGISPCAANSLSVSSTSSNVQLSTCGASLIIMNLTSQEAFYTVGQASTTAATTAGNTTASYSLPGGAYELITVPGLTGDKNGWYFAAITATSTTTIRMIQGNAQ